MREAVSAAIAVVVCALATTGCGEGGADVRLSDGEPPIFTFHGDGGMDALVSGRLIYLDDQQCVVLEIGPSHNLAVFPAGSDAHFETDGTLIVDMEGFGPLREGVSITGGGGYLSSDQGEGLPAVPTGCSSDGTTYAVLQSISEAS